MRGGGGEFHKSIGKLFENELRLGVTSLAVKRSSFLCRMFTIYHNIITALYSSSERCGIVQCARSKHSHKFNFYFQMSSAEWVMALRSSTSFHFIIRFDSFLLHSLRQFISSIAFRLSSYVSYLPFLYHFPPPPLPHLSCESDFGPDNEADRSSDAKIPSILFFVACVCAHTRHAAIRPD